MVDFILGCPRAHSIPLSYATRRRCKAGEASGNALSMNAIHRAAIRYLPALIVCAAAGPSVCATPANAPLSVLSPAGPVLRAERIMLLDSLVIMLAIVIPTMIAIGCFAWWFRAKHTRARYLPNWEY